MRVVFSLDLPSGSKYFASKYLGILCLFFLPIWGLAQNKSKEELERERQHLKQEIERTSRELEAVKKAQKVSLNEIALVKKKMGLRRQQINNINQQLASIENRMQEQSKSIEHLKQNIAKYKNDYIKSIVVSYKFYQLYNPTLYLLNTENFSNLIDRINYLRAYRDLRTRTLSQVKSTHRVLEQELNRLSVNKGSKEQILSEQKDEFESLRQEEREKQDALNKINSNRRKLAQTLHEKQKRWTKIRTLIQQEIKREMARNKAEAQRRLREHKESKTAKNEASKSKSYALNFSDKDYKLAKNFLENKGRLPWPIDGYITMSFGKNTIAEGSNISYNNSGITLRARGLNKPIKAVFNGSVTSVQYMDGGMLVTIRHGKYWTIYTPVYKPTVKAGQEVKTNEIIGYSGDSDNTAELEFQVMQETKFLNPELWLRKQ